LHDTATVATNGTADLNAANNTSNTVTTTTTVGDITLSYHQNLFTLPVPAGTIVNIAGSLAYFLDRDLGLHFDRTFYQNFAGMNEKWLRGNGNQFGNPWYFIKPNGQLFQWDGTMTAQGSTLVGTLDPVYYVYPDLLYQATQGMFDYVLQQRLGLTSTGNFFENEGGRNEKWLAGNLNTYGNPWYFIDTGGRLYAWDGTPHRATGT